MRLAEVNAQVQAAVPGCAHVNFGERACGRPLVARFDRKRKNREQSKHEFGGGSLRGARAARRRVASVAFAYRIVARHKGIKRHRRLAKIDVGLPVRARAPRQAAPTPAALRAFVAGLEKEARQRRPKGAKKAGSARALAKGLSLVWSPPHARRDAFSRPM